MQTRYSATWYYETADRFSAFAQAKGYHPVSLAAAWVAAHPAITAPIIGARDLTQLEASLESLEIEVTPELRAEITALSVDPPVAADRDEER
jgi:aryl-alcohol dehydrogenase-like predicted oxidoreductase